MTPAASPTPHGGGALLPGVPIETGLVYAFGGAVYAVAGWLNSRAKREEDIPFRPRKAAQTVLIGAVAGVIVATQGDELSGANVEAAMALAIPIVNQLVNMSKQAAQQE